MFINLFSFRSLGQPLYVLLLDMSLKGSNLLVDSRNILLNYVCQFLSSRLSLEKSPNKKPLAYADFDGTIVEQGLSLSNLNLPSAGGK